MYPAFVFASPFIVMIATVAFIVPRVRGIFQA